MKPALTRQVSKLAAQAIASESSAARSEALRYIEHGRTADYLMEPRSGWRFFWPFLGAERSLSEVARLIDAPLNQVHYHVGIMLRLDLIRVTRTQARAGRPMRLYRSSFDACFIPFETTSAESFAALLSRNDALWGQWLSWNLARVWSKADGRWGWYCSRSPEGIVRVEERPRHHESDWDPLASDAPSASNRWALIGLDDSQAKRLQRELNELIERYLLEVGTNPRASKTTKYLVHAALAPVDSDG